MTSSTVNTTKKTTTPIKQTKNQIKHAKKLKRKQDFLKRLITNLSDHTLSMTEFEALSKGLKFIPKRMIKPIEVRDAIHSLTRRMSLAFHFRCSTYQPPRLHKPTHWAPPTPKNSSLNTFFFRINHEIKQLQISDLPTDNLSAEEQNAIQFFRYHPSLTIKPADKGGSLVIMNTKDYYDKVHAQLSEPQNYKKLPHNPTLSIAHNISNP